MIRSIDAATAMPAEKAEIIYAHARFEVSARLWRAALGTSETHDRAQDNIPVAGMDAFKTDLDTLLAALDAPARTAEPPLANGPMLATPSVMPKTAAYISEDGRPSGLGVNANHQTALDQAAARTGIPASALAAIINAEAAKHPNGAWKANSRNPRSSAAGLGQFLSGTWESEAKRAGTWLNDVARSKGWVDQSGRLLAQARPALLALRFDPGASINATADYARSSLDRIGRAGISVGGSSDDVAQAAYLGHHLGPGDAIKFLRGGLSSARAKLLLDAQIGSTNSNRLIAQTGNASAAHRNWLLDYVDRKVDTARFAV